MRYLGGARIVSKNRNGRRKVSREKFPISQPHVSPGTWIWLFPLHSPGETNPESPSYVPVYTPPSLAFSLQKPHTKRTQPRERAGYPPGLPRRARASPLGAA